LLAKTSHSGRFVRLNIENREKPRDLDDVVHALGQIDELQFALRAADGGICAHQFANAGAVDVIHVGQVEQDFPLTDTHEIADHLAKHSAAFAQCDPAAEINDGDITHVAACTL